MKQTDLLFIAYKPLIRRAAFETLVGRKRSPVLDLRGRFTDRDVWAILHDTWLEYESLKTDIPRHHSFGNNMNAHLACLTLSSWHSMKNHEVDSSYSIELISDMAWYIYRQWSWIVKTLTRIVHRNSEDRLQAAVKGFLKFPFSAPGYEAEVELSPRGINLNMVKCLVADYFIENDAQDLCVRAWCNQDYALVEMWGGNLTRTTTLAEGCEKCDFKFSTG